MRSDAAISEKLPILAVPLSSSPSIYGVNRRKNSYKPHNGQELAYSSFSLATFLPLTVKVIQSRMVSSESYHVRLRSSGVPSGKRTLFINKLIRPKLWGTAYGGIQGHPYWFPPIA